MKHILIAVLAMASVISAQEFRGTISGTVTDPSGAAIGKVKIVATESRTGTKSEVFSEASGAYTIPFLAPGQYQITASVAGFKTFSQRGITLSVGEHPVIDVHLDVGAITESVTVTADAPMVSEANASVGQIITTAEVEDFPVNGRTPMMLAHMAFGVISTFEPGPVRPFDNGSGNALTIGGAQSGTNEVLLNGSPNAGFSKQMAYSPSQDAVQEVRVSAFDADAAYGHSGGGTINVVTKSGTNGFHGAAHEFNQSSVLNANSFFVNKAGNPRPAYHYNQYGATVSGPVMLPKVYDGRNKVFWLFSWEGLRDADPANSPIETGSPVNFATVPTAAERQGDFSALLKANKAGTDYTIYDPNSGVQNGSTVARTPFAGNVIPQNRLSKTALNLLQFFPAPNNPAARIDGAQNYIIAAIDKDTYDNELGQVDINLSSRHKLSINARHNYRAQDKNNYFHNVATGTFLYRINQGAQFDDVYTISPSTVMDIRGSWTRYMENRATPSDGLDLTTLGFPSYINNASQFLKLPRLIFTNTTITAGAQQSFQTLGDNGGGANAYDSFQLFASVVKIHGNQTIKMGTDIRQYRWSAYSQSNSAGTYTFGTGSNANWTVGPNANTAAAPLGQDLAEFLLGLPTSGSFDLNTQSTIQAKYYAMFIQDDWRVKRNLTLNLGLRFEHDTPTTERYLRAVNGFDPTAPNSATAPAQAAFATALAAGTYANSPLTSIQFKALGGYTFPNSTDPFLYHTQSYFFSPRFGFAWTPQALGGKTVIRGGFAMFASPIEILGNGSSTSATLVQAGFSQTTSMTASNNSFLTPASSLSDPFPAGFVAPSGNSKGASTFIGQNAQFYNPTPHDPYSMRWNIGIQRVLPGQMVLEVAYIGNHAVRLPISTQMDAVPQQYLSHSLVRDQPTIDLLTGTVTNPFKGLIATGGTLNGNTVARQQLLVPYPQFLVGSGTSNGVLMDGNPAGSSYFHSLNARVQKRFTNGLTFLYNFTYSKLISKVNYLNDYDPSPEKRVANDNRPLRSVLAGSYELPIGNSKRFHFNSRMANRMVGGWAFNGVWTMQSGSQLGWGNLVYFGGPLNLDTHQPDGLAFDTTRFATASNAQLANNIRWFNSQFNNLRRDLVKNLDLSMIKRFDLGERRYFQLRFETFNTTNRVTFGNPNTTANSSAFGTITTQANTPRRIQVGGRLVW